MRTVRQLVMAGAAGFCLALGGQANAATGSGTLDFTFTGFSGAFASAPASADPSNPADYSLIGSVNGVEPVYNGTSVDAGFGFRYLGGDGPLSGQSATLVYDNLPGAIPNVITFTPEAGFSNVSTGQPFKVGTLSFTNGQWVGGSFDPLNNMVSNLNFTLTTASSTPEFNQVIHDSVMMTTNQLKNRIAPDGTDLCTTSQGQMDEADFVSFAGAPQLGSLRVYDQTCKPSGATNQGTIDLWMKFGSLDYDSLKNVGGSGFFSPSTGVGNLGVPEPATWSMLILGFGALGLAMRRRRALAPI